MAFAKSVKVKAIAIAISLLTGVLVGAVLTAHGGTRSETSSVMPKQRVALPALKDSGDLLDIAKIKLVIPQAATTLFVLANPSADNREKDYYSESSESAWSSLEQKLAVFEADSALSSDVQAIRAMLDRDHMSGRDPDFDSASVQVSTWQGVEVSGDTALVRCIEVTHLHQGSSDILSPDGPLQWTYTMHRIDSIWKIVASSFVGTVPEN